MTKGILGTLAGIVFLRVLGVSLLFAGFAEHAHALGGSTIAAGLAFGAYPLALAAFMLPLAALSDRVGRRPVMLAALAVSAGGGIAAAFAPDITTLALARFVQGAGAVNGVALALAGEIGEPDRRTRRMALLGAAAGIGFAAGILLGAWLTPAIGVPGLLLGHSVVSLALLVPVWRLVPASPPAASASASAIPPAASASPSAPGRVDARVYTLGAAAFAINLALTGLLFLSPLLITGIPYALAVTLMVLPGGLGMFLAARLADRGHARAVGLAGALLLGLAPLAFLALVHVPGPALVAAGMLFFVGHSSLSSLLPSLASATATEGRRGFSQGVQSTMQYVGSFLGASLMGALYPRAAPLAAAFLVAGAIVALAVARATVATPPS
ncbi:MAG TPA: MFS transporter [Candidatus Thermoplasmatota archaeon]|nr:MFS transporter [Candidatus Thermoplasmatota archaeon]